MYSLSLPAILDQVARQELIVGAFLLVSGLMFIVMGVRLSRLLVALSFGVIGFVLGGSIPVDQPIARVILAGCGAISLATLSLFVVRPAVAVLAGVWAALATLTFCVQFGADPQIMMFVAVFAFAAAASMTYITYYEIIAFITSLEGTLLFIGGLMVFFSQSTVLWNHVRSLLVASPLFPPFLVLAGTFTGFYLQLSELQKKRVGRSA